ncbi:mavicyanin-like [Bidens hawaiensis]|uniref:mavicyanin-like n=1 Tax=Bidens hawaiensis TaxID=980011 RepID=UPI004049981F
MGKEKLAIIFLLIAASMVQHTWARASGDLIIEKEKVSVIKAGTEPTTHAVGDDKGWDVGVDYKAWAASKDIRVGDEMYFRYDNTKHNVYIVKAKQFEECSTIDPIGVYSPGCGNLAITIGAPGDHYYFSAVGDDCQKGMKIFV